VADSGLVSESVAARSSAHCCSRSAGSGGLQKSAEWVKYKGGGLGSRRTGPGLGGLGGRAIDSKIRRTRVRGLYGGGGRPVSHLEY
jgi:hypothetical protein